MHKTLTEVALEALNWKNHNLDRREAERERQALSRLRKSVADLVSERLAGDRRYIVMLHRWLDDTYPHGNRSVARILEGMEALGTTDYRR